MMGTTIGAIAGYHYGGRNLRGTVIGGAIGLTASTKKGRKLVAKGFRKGLELAKAGARAAMRKYRERRAGRR